MAEARDALKGELNRLAALEADGWDPGSHNGFQVLVDQTRPDDYLTLLVTFRDVDGSAGLHLLGAVQPWVYGRRVMPRWRHRTGAVLRYSDAGMRAMS